MNFHHAVSRFLVCGVLICCATGACSLAADVNPLTGVPLSLEQTHWALEQARLEEQLQASLLNRRKFELERQRLDTATADAPMVPGEPSTALRPPSEIRRAALLPPAQLARPSPPPVTPAIGARTTVRRGAGDHRQKPPPVVPWTVVGVRTQGAQWCVLVLEDGQLWPGCPGDWRRGHHVDEVSATDYTVDGVSFALDVPLTHLQRGAIGSPQGAGLEAIESAVRSAEPALDSRADAASILSSPGTPSPGLVAGNAAQGLPEARSQP
jgi:hypothetical protein